MLYAIYVHLCPATVQILVKKENIKLLYSKILFYDFAMRTVLRNRVVLVLFQIWQRNHWLWQYCCVRQTIIIAYYNHNHIQKWYSNNYCRCIAVTVHPPPEPIDSVSWSLIYLLCLSIYFLLVSVFAATLRTDQSVVWLQTLFSVAAAYYWTEYSVLVTAVCQVREWEKVFDQDGQSFKFVVCLGWLCPLHSSMCRNSSGYFMRVNCLGQVVD